MSEEDLTHASELYRTSVHDKERAIGLQEPNRAGTSCQNLCRLDPLRLGVWRCIHGRILVKVYADLFEARCLLGQGRPVYPLLYGASNHVRGVPNGATCGSPCCRCILRHRNPRPTMNGSQTHGSQVWLLSATGRFAIELQFLQCRPRGSFRRGR